MEKEKSEISNRSFPKRLILQVAELSPSAWYDKRVRIKEIDKKKRGPITSISDKIVLEHLREILEEPLFVGEGYIKLHARLKQKNLKIGKNRLYRIMKAENLLTHKYGNKGSGRLHNGTIITEHPNRMWATDGKQFYVNQEGKCWFIGIIDHFNDEIKAFYICKTFDRYAAMEPMRMAVKKVYGSIENGVCKGMNIAMRADHGSQFDSKDYQKEIEYLGINYSPAFVRSPECNGIIERFHRTLNEQIFKNYSFENIEQANKKISEFIDNYNENWLLHRLDLKSPKEYLKWYNQSKEQGKKG